MSNATELLRQTLDAWDDEGTFDYLGTMDCLMEEIRAFLAAEPEADEPVAWIQPNHLEKAQFMPFLCRVEPKQRDDFIPIYAKPEPARKPMTEEEIDEELETNEYYCAKSFADGVRFAEKHHFGMGINQSDPDSIDLQSRCRGDKL